MCAWLALSPKARTSCARASMRGNPWRPATIDTVADGLAAPFAGDLSQAVIEHYVDDVMLVPDSAIVDAMRPDPRPLQGAG